MASLTVCVFRGNTSICCTSCSNSTEARRAVYRELRQVQVHSDGLWHKGDWNRSFSLVAFTSCILKGANSQLSPHTCNKPAEPIVAQKWSQQLPSKRNRYLSREYLLTLVTSKKLKDTSQVTQNYTNFSPGHKVPSNYGSKKKKVTVEAAAQSVYRRLYSPEADKVCYNLENGTKLVGMLLK